MTNKTERIASLAEKKGIKASLQSGHILNEEELRGLKIQIVPGPFRLFLAILGIAATGLSSECFVIDCDLAGYLSGVLALFLILFAIFGVRRTLGQILDSMDAVDACELLGTIIEGIIEAIGGAY